MTMERIGRYLFVAPQCLVWHPERIAVVAGLLLVVGVGVTYARGRVAWPLVVVSLAWFVFSACVPKTSGLVANRRKPCCVIRQKAQDSSDKASNHALAAGWWTCESNVNASHTFTSGSSIFFVQNLGNSLAG